MIFEGATRNCAASVSTRNTSTKNSKASSVHPRKLAVTACHWSERDKEVASSVEPVEFIGVARWLVARGPSYIPESTPLRHPGAGTKSLLWLVLAIDNHPL